MQQGQPDQYNGPERRTQHEVRLSGDTLAHIQQQMEAAVTKAMANIINEQTAEAFWRAGFNVLQKQAATHTGRFVLGGLWGFARKLALFVAVGSIIYATGGWAALSALGKALFTEAGH